MSTNLNEDRAHIGQGSFATVAGNPTNTKTTQEDGVQVEVIDKGKNRAHKSRAPLIILSTFFGIVSTLEVLLFLEAKYKVSGALNDVKNIDVEKAKNFLKSDWMYLIILASFAATMISIFSTISRHRNSLVILLENERNILENERNKRTIELNGVKIELNDVKNEKDSLSKEKSNLEGEKTTLSEQIGKIKLELDTLKNQQQVAQEQIQQQSVVASNAAKVEEKVRQNSNENEKLNILILKKDDDIGKLKGGLKTLEENRKSIEAKLTDVESQIKSKDNEIKSKNDQIKSLDEQMKLLKVELEKFNVFYNDTELLFKRVIDLERPNFKESMKQLNDMNRLLISEITRYQKEKEIYEATRPNDVERKGSGGSTGSKGSDQHDDVFKKVKVWVSDKFSRSGSSESGKSNQSNKQSRSRSGSSESREESQLQMEAIGQNANVNGDRYSIDKAIEFVKEVESLEEEYKKVNDIYDNNISNDQINGKIDVIYSLDKISKEVEKKLKENVIQDVKDDRLKIHKRNEEALRRYRDENFSSKNGTYFISNGELSYLSTVVEETGGHTSLQKNDCLTKNVSIISEDSVEDIKSEAEKNICERIKIDANNSIIFNNSNAWVHNCKSDCYFKIDVLMISGDQSEFKEGYLDILLNKADNIEKDFFVFYENKEIDNENSELRQFKLSGQMIKEAQPSLRYFTLASYLTSQVAGQEV
jgi:hypothetical protein